MLPFTTPSPTPNPADIPTEPWEATPGVEGFLLGFFFLGIVLAFLMWSMNRRLRKINHAATSEQRRAEEARAAKAAASGAEPAVTAGTAPTPQTAETAGDEPREKPES